MMCGGVPAVRGVLGPVDELVYILTHSQSSILITETSQVLDRVLQSMTAPQAAAIQHAVVLYEEDESVLQGLQALLRVCLCVCCAYPAGMQSVVHTRVGIGLVVRPGLLQG